MYATAFDWIKLELPPLCVIESVLLTNSGNFPSDQGLNFGTAVSSSTSTVVEIHVAMVYSIMTTGKS